MNPLTRALKLAEDPGTEAAERPAGQSSDTVVAERLRLDPVRATRSEPDPDPSPATLAMGDSSGAEAAEGMRPAPMPAMEDCPVPQIQPPAAIAVGETHVPEAPQGARPAPMPAAGDRTTGNAVISGDGRAAPELPAPAGSAGAPSRPGGASAGDTGATGTAGRRDDRPIGRSGGIGRLVVIAVSSLAVAGATAGGGAFLWKTEFTRPALVRHLSALPVTATGAGKQAGPGTDSTPMHAANAVDGRTLAPATGAAPGTGAPPITVTTPGDALLPIFPATTQESAGHRIPSAAAAGSEGLPTLTTATPEDEERPALSPAAAKRTGFATGQVATPRAEELPAGSPATPATRATPAPEPSPDRLQAPEAVPNPRASTGVEHAAPAPERDEAERWPESGARIVIRKRIRADHVAASLERAYETYVAGDVEAAEPAYRAVLGDEPGNRDARLGLAAIAARAGRWDEAAEHYTALLASHPADTAARAALIAIGEKDPARAESRLKALLRSDPEAARLHASLGSLQAAQSRWPEAQRSWFNAYRLERGNADHAYNLAVSLDHLSQSRSALEFYREALALTRRGPASFESDAVRERIRTLESRAAGDSAPGGPPGEAATAATAHIR